MINFFGSVIATIGIIMFMICGGGETFVNCILCGGIGLALMSLGAVMINVSDERD